jgi:GDPmannose 4,6-dehydratase
MARILVTGFSGQIGSYLVEQLLADGHDVIGIGSPSDVFRGEVKPAKGSLDRVDSLLDENGALDAVVHLAARSSVSASWADPMGTFDTNARMAAAVAYGAAKRRLRLVHASSAEIFGNAASPVQDETTPISPISPYAVAKASAHLAVQLAREGFGAPASNLIFYLGESPRRASFFVFRKITGTVAAIAAGAASELVLGSTSVVRDFCHARDLASAARMLALGAPAGDYICASGEGHSILDVATLACKIAGVPSSVIRANAPSLVRPNDVQSLIGDSRRLRTLGWRPSVGFEELVREVLEYDTSLRSSARAAPQDSPRRNPP